MFDASTLEVFIASTNDLTDERAAVEDVLRDWNSRHGKGRQIMLKPVRWEEDATPELGPGSFQAVINKRLLDLADVLIGVVGKRLGSPTKAGVSGTVEEIERFAAARKPVLLYFSDRPFNLSDIDPGELERVRAFSSAMQERGLYRTFRDLADFKAKLRSHLDTLLQDFHALLIPAGRALAYGYYKNFVAQAHSILRGLKVDLPDYAVGEGGGADAAMVLTFASFRIRIARPASLDEATDDAVFTLRKDLAEINVKTPTLRRAYRIYVPRETKRLLDEAQGENLDRAKRGERPRPQVQLDRLDVIDFPTPLIALHEFVAVEEESILTAGEGEGAAAGYWQSQKTIQYDTFFQALKSYIAKDGKQGPSIPEPFAFRNTSDFTLPD